MLLTNVNHPCSKLLLVITLIFANHLSLNAQNITLIQGLKDQKVFTNNIDVLKESDISLHFLMPTIGRKTIFNMLNTLERQVKPQDFLTIIFDAKDIDHVFDDVKQKISTFNCQTNIIFEQKNLGYWGHGIRNKYNNLSGDYILHCDDDNTYLPGSISAIRRICIDKSKLYIFKVKFCKDTIWGKPKIQLGNIDTACGVIPSKYNSLSTWQPVYGGDYEFYQTLVENLDNSQIVFVDYVVYRLPCLRSRNFAIE